MTAFIFRSSRRYRRRRLRRLSRFQRLPISTIDRRRVVDRPLHAGGRRASVGIGSLPCDFRRLARLADDYACRIGRDRAADGSRAARSIGQLWSPFNDLDRNVTDRSRPHCARYGRAWRASVAVVVILVAACARESQFACQDDSKQPAPTKCEEPSKSHRESPVPQPSFSRLQAPRPPTRRVLVSTPNAKDSTAKHCAVDR
jgi:hypothetical protein